MSLITFLKHPVLSFRFHLLSIAARILPVSRKLIVFNNFNGKGFGDSPKYIAEVLHHTHPEYKYVWLLKKGNVGRLPSFFKIALTDGIHDKYYLSRAKVIVTSSRYYLYLPKKKGQYLINTWHAIFGPKYAELAATDILSTEYIDFIKRNNLDIDLFLAGSNWQANDFRSNFGYEGEIMRSGLPRDDIYFNANKNVVKTIRERLGVGDDEKLIVYSPTFRDSGDISIYNLPVGQILDTLESSTGLHWKILIRLHPNVPVEVKNLFHYDTNVIEATTYPDMQELLLISDLMITDYSSCMFDFIIQKKPVILYCPDLCSGHIRGLSPIFNHLPFPLCKNAQEVITVLEQFDDYKYQKVLKEFLDNYKSVWGDQFISYDDGKASERVAKHIINVMEH